MLQLRIKNLVFAVVILVFAGSCRKVITLDLHSAAPKLVVEADVTNQTGGCQVLLSRTVDFQKDNSFPPVSGASVRITDNAGNVSVLQETSPGTYTSNLLGATGVTYQLQIIAGTDTVTSTSTMPVLVNFDSLFVTNDQIFGNTWELANVAYTDPSDPGHYYQFVQWVNGVKVPQIYTADNELTAGRAQDIKLYLDPNTKDKNKIKKGDDISVEMQCLDEGAHKYWFSAQQSASGNSQNAVPANPVTNLVGNALGYFSAHTSQTRSIVAP
jgi:hypothetical protein